jgi:hypothetical protein
VRYGRPIATSALFAVLGAPAFAAEDCGGADRLLVNGRIVTMDDSTSIAEAAAIRDRRFVAVGRGRRAGRLDRRVRLGRREARREALRDPR